MTSNRLLIIIALLLFLPPGAGAKSKPASLKRPTYATVQMSLQPVAYRLSSNARRIQGVRNDLQAIAARGETERSSSMDAESLEQARQIAQVLTELVLRLEHQVELMELAPLIEIESKHDYFMRRLDQLYLSREIIQELLAQIDAGSGKIQHNPVLRLVERAKFFVGNTLEQYDSGIKAISDLEPAVRAGK